MPFFEQKDNQNQPRLKRKKKRKRRKKHSVSSLGLAFPSLRGRRRGRGGSRACPALSSLSCSLDFSPAFQGAEMPPHGLAICLLSMSSLTQKDRAQRWPIKTIRHARRQGEILLTPGAGSSCLLSLAPSKLSGADDSQGGGKDPCLTSNLLPVPCKHPLCLRLSSTAAQLPPVAHVTCHLFGHVKHGPQELHLMTFRSGMVKDWDQLTPSHPSQLVTGLTVVSVP